MRKYKPGRLPKVLLIAGLCSAVALGWIWKSTRSGASVNPPPVTSASAKAAVPSPNPPAPQALVGSPKASTAGEPKKALASLTYATGWDHESKPAFAPFNAWVNRYLNAPASARAAMEKEGEDLAAVRLKAMEDLIQQDPEEAIASTVPARILPQLPVLILAKLEKRVAGTGNYDVKEVCFLPVQKEKETDAVLRSAIFGANKFKAFTYGRRLGESTKLGVPMHGVSVGKLLALHESPVRVLERGEAADASLTQIAPPAPVPGEATVDIQVGSFAIGPISTSQAIQLQADILSAEAKLGPYVQMQGWGAQLFPVVSPAITGTTPKPWTTGTQNILIIRVDFPDLAGDPVAQGDAQTLMNTSVAPFYNGSSFKQDNQISTVTAKTYRMPQLARYYAVNELNDQLHADAEALATADGYNLADYDRIGVVFKYLGGIDKSQIYYGGLAQIGGVNFWVNGEFDFRIVSHELGHTYGLYHANLWYTFNTGGSPVGNGFSYEYGDEWDTMGRDSANATVDFGPSRKEKLEWITPGAVLSATQSGIYRVYRFDDPTTSATSGNLMAVRISRDAYRSYYIAYRKKSVTTTNLPKSAYIFWRNDVEDEYGYPAGYTNLLDMTTPGISSADAGLALQTSFVDSAVQTGGSPLVITPLTISGTSPNEYLDVQVSFNNSAELETNFYKVTESDGSVSLTVKRTGDGAGMLRVVYMTVNGTAVSPDDYSGTGGMLTWQDGDTSDRTIRVDLCPGRVVNGTVDFKVILTSPLGGVVNSSKSSATIQIQAPGILNSGFSPLPPSAFNVPDGTSVTVLDSGSGTLSVAGSGVLSNATGLLASSGSLNLAGNSAQISGVSLNSGGINGDVKSVVIQPDGSVLVGGKFSGMTYSGTATLSGTDATSLLPVSLTGNLTLNVVMPGFLRLLPDGSLDPNFFTGSGVASADTNPVNGIALQPNGQVVIVGGFSAVQGVPVNRMARLNADGRLDSSFNPDLPDGEVKAVAIQPDAKILIVGAFQYVGAVYTPYVARLNPDGSLDGSFVSPLAFDANRSAECVALQPDGGILVGGNFFAGVTRLLASGSLDGNFSVGLGAAYTGTAGNMAGTISAIAIKPDGRIIVGGNFNKFNGTWRTRLVQLKADGSLDNTFAVSIDPAGDSSVQVRTIVPDVAGGMFIGGEFATVNAKSSPRLVRLNTDGSLDSSFYVGSGASNTVNCISLAGDGSVALGQAVGAAASGNPSLQGQANQAVAMLIGKNVWAGQVKFDLPSYTGYPADGSVQVMVQREGGSAGPISVNFSTVDGSAVAGTDYGTNSGTLTWADGDQAPKFIDLSITGSTDRTFYISLGTALGGVQVGSQGWVPVNVRTDNRVPLKPTNQSPKPEAVDQPTSWQFLQGDNYSDPNGDAQVAAQWMVYRDSDGALVYPRPLVDNVIDYNNLSYIYLPVDLELGTKYRWQVRYMDSKGGWSAFSDPTTFTVHPLWALRFNQQSYTVSESGTYANLTIIRTSGTAGVLYTGSDSVFASFYTMNGSAVSGVQYQGVSTGVYFSGTQNTKTILIPINDNNIPNGNTQFFGRLSDYDSDWEVPNPVVAINIQDNEFFSFRTFAGSYTGLIASGSNPPSTATTGFLSASVDRNGVFTASILFGGQTYSLKGQFGAYGDFSGFIPHTLLKVTLKLDMTGSDTLTGEIKNTINGISGKISTNRAVFDAVHFPAFQKGTYHILLTPGVEDLPQGNGYGTLTVDGYGKGRFAGSLGDGTKVTQNLSLAKDGTWPFFIPVYKNQGFISGTVSYTASSQIAFNGPLTWIKPASKLAKDPLYPNGFTAAPTLIGARYVVPVKGASAPYSDAKLTISGGGVTVSPSPVKALTWGIGYKLTNNPVLDTSFKMTINPSSGLMSGSFLDRSTGKTKSFTGIYLQIRDDVGHDIGYGGGLFIGNGGITGGVKFEKNTPNPE